MESVESDETNGSNYSTKRATGRKARAPLSSGGSSDEEDISAPVATSKANLAVPVRVGKKRGRQDTPEDNHGSGVPGSDGGGSSDNENASTPAADLEASSTAAGTVGKKRGHRDSSPAVTIPPRHRAQTTFNLLQVVRRGTIKDDGKSNYF